MTRSPCLNLKRTQGLTAGCFVRQDFGKPLLGRREERALRSLVEQQSCRPRPARSAQNSTPPMIRPVSESRRRRSAAGREALQKELLTLGLIEDRQRHSLVGRGLRSSHAWVLTSSHGLCYCEQASIHTLRCQKCGARILPSPSEMKRWRRGAGLTQRQMGPRLGTPTRKSRVYRNRLAVVAMVVVVLGADRVAHAACTDCTLVGNVSEGNAGTGSTGLNETAFGYLGCERLSYRCQRRPLKAPRLDGSVHFFSVIHRHKRGTR